MIYKILPRSDWEQAVAAGTFAGAAIDLQDGYIHFSAAHQVKETAAKHFTGQANLVLVAVDDTRLGESLIWEVSRGGDRFPHLYALLDVSDVGDVFDLPLDKHGVHLFPNL